MHNYTPCVDVITCGCGGGQSRLHLSVLSLNFLVMGSVLANIIRVAFRDVPLHVYLFFILFFEVEGMIL